MRTVSIGILIFGCLLGMSCSKKDKEKTYGCPPLSYHYTSKFVIKSKATGENLLEKEVYKKEAIRIFCLNGQGQYDTIYRYQAGGGRYQDTIAVIIAAGASIINNSRDFYIKYNSVDIDTLRIQTKIGKKEACVTWYAPVQFYVNSKAAATPEDLWGNFVIYK